MKIKKIKPMFTKILVTMEKYGADEMVGSIIDANKMQGTTKEIQKVISVGGSVREIAEGDYVKIDPKKYAVHKYAENSVKKDLLNDEIIGYKIPQVEVDGHTYMLLDSQDVEYVITEFEEDKPDSGLIHTEKQIILN